MFNLTKLSISLGLSTLLSVKFLLGALITLFSLPAQADGFFVGTSASFVQANVTMADDSQKKLKINQQNVNPTMRMHRRTVQLGRATCSYCPDVQRWTKILGFLHCGCETVINHFGWNY